MPDWKAEIRQRLIRSQLTPTRENAIVEELAAHLDESYAELLASGVSEADAYRQLRAELHDGGLLTHGLQRVERSTNSEPIILGTNQRTNMIADLWQDLRYGARMLMKQKGVTAIAVLSLALGIGANTAIFSLASAVLFQTPPVANAKSVMNVIGERRDSFPISYLDYRDYRERNHVFSDLLCWSETSLSLSGGGQVEAVPGMMVSGNYFALLGVQPVLGRFFLPEEDRAAGAQPVVVIGYGLWQRRFGGAAEAVGQSINLNGYPFTIIGVAPRGFTSTRTLFTTDAWVPVLMQAQLQSLAKLLNSRDTRWVQMTGRLKPGVSRTQAEADLSAVERQLTAEYPNRLPGANFNAITPGHLALLKLRLLRGRDFNEADQPGAPRVAIIDETAARQWFAGREALGQRLTNGQEEYEIIGVTESAQLRASESAAEPLVYLPLAQSFNSKLVIHMRTQVAAAEAYAALRSTTAALDDRIALQYTMPLSEYLRLELLPQRLVASLAGACGLVGLALAAIGIFGMVSYAVAQRTHEIGIRMALGAQTGDVLRLVLRQGVGVALAGLTLGLLGALILTRLLVKLLYGISPTDPLIFTTISLLLLGATLLACWIPARRATKVDPLAALRSE